MIGIQYVSGDATSPVTGGSKIICHVCNDIGAWGAGFVLALSRKWKEPEQDYRNWFKNGSPKLGHTLFSMIDSSLYVANMIGQHGCGWSNGIPPIRYDALLRCLEQVLDFAIKKGCSVHMPKIGCGLAGGVWKEIEPLIVKSLSERDIPVYVYTLG